MRNRASQTLDSRNALKCIVITDLVFALSKKIRDECNFYGIELQKTSAISYLGYSLPIKVGQMSMCTLKRKYIA